MQLTLPTALKGALAFALAAAMAPAALAQSVTRVDGTTHAGSPSETGTAPGTVHHIGGAITITQSASQTIEALGSVSCNAGGLHTDNSYLRVFDLATHGITEDFDITSVETGVEQAVGNTGSQPIEWKFFVLTNPAGTITRGNFTPIGTLATTVPDMSLALHASAITGVTAPAGSRLVVELFTPNGQTAINSFFLGANAAGQTGPTYLEAADCGVTAPTPTGSIGFPNMHWVLNVTGETGGGGGPVVFPSTDTPIAIPDGTPAGTNSVINVPSTLMIDDLDIGFTVTHPWAGDVRATLNHGATTIAIFDRPGVPATTFGCNGDNPDIILDDEGTDGAVETSCVNDPGPAYTPGGRYVPNELLTTFDGIDAMGDWTLNISDNALPDPGTLDSWSLMITEAPGGPIVNTYPSTGGPFPVLDGSGSDVPGPPTTNTITVPASPNIVLDVDFAFVMTHTFIGDLIASVEHDATSVTFLDRPGRTTTGFGCGGDNPNVVADDEGTDGALETSCTAANPGYPVIGGHYTPNNPLTAFDGADVEGDWTITITDNAGGDTGSLTSWALIITEINPTASPGDPTASEASLRALPNPMTSAGTVELTVGTSQDVRVAVYDMLGREVMVIFDGTVAASQRALISVAAGRLDAGVYVIRATGEDFTAIQRVTIVR